MSSVIIGKNINVKVVYNDQPTVVRANSFEATDDAELRKRQHLGNDAPEPDYIADGWSLSMTVAKDGPQLDGIIADMRARQRANLPPRSLSITALSVFRDGATAPTSHTFTKVAMTVGTNVGGRTEDVTHAVKAIAADRVDA